MLNAAVDPAADMCIEYNGVLARTGLEVEAQDKLVGALGTDAWPWDELQVRNLSPPCFDAGAATVLRRLGDDPFNGWVAGLAPGLDVEALLQRLSTNRRSQIRRSFKACAAPGPLQVHEAPDLGSALAYFCRLGELHNARWRREGIAGAFEGADWVAFHEGVIRRAFPRGEIQLLRIAAGDTDVGYLYNIRWRRTVAMVQSGFVEPASNAHRPGFVCHLLAMAYNAARGVTEYDFLGGDAEYKRVLGTRATAQQNLRLQRPGVWRLRLEELLVQGIRRWRRR
jgi:CelD/BcsL family acetyltransferase involved in cellulose biosynthesis